MRGRFLAGLYRIAVTLVATFGVALNVTENSWGDSLVYFTVQSNILLAVVFAWSAWASFTDRGHLPGWLKGGATLFISITGLVFNFVLADIPETPQADGAPSPAMELATWLLHTATPLLAVLDWLFFDEHRRFGLRHAAAWLAYPAAYFVFALARGAITDSPERYPYPFIDLDALGAGGVTINVFIYAIAFYILGLVFVYVDRILPANTHPQPISEQTVDRAAA